MERSARRGRKGTKRSRAGHPECSRPGSSGIFAEMPRSVSRAHARSSIAIVFFLAGCSSCKRAMDEALPAPPTPAATTTTTAPPAATTSTPPTPSTPAACGGPLFIDAPLAWTEVTIASGGMDAIRSAIESSDRAKPTRITVKAGTYRGRCLYVEGHTRSAAAPLWLRAEGEAQIDCSDGNGQAIAIERSSYVAIDGFTIGPATGGYGDSAIHISGTPKNPTSRDPKDYGGHEPAHHVIVRRLTARNLLRPADGDGDARHYESGCCDAVKSNQAEYVWVVDSKVSKTARHGFDNVGVHHAYFCNNVLTDMNGAGFAMEAKGGSDDVLFERNVVIGSRRRGIVLGGEGTDNVFMWPWDAPYEARGVVARANVVINAAEGGLSFYGCQGCAAVGNTVWLTAGFTSWTGDKMTAEPHDAMRMYASVMEGQADDLRSGWKPRRVGEKLLCKDNRVVNNLFGAAAGDMTCALDAGEGATGGLVMKSNAWFNGGKALPACDTGDVAKKWPDPRSLFGDFAVGVKNASARAAEDLRPIAGSKLVGAGVSDPAAPTVDLTGRARPAPPAIGALER